MGGKNEVRIKFLDKQKIFDFDAEKEFWNKPYNTTTEFTDIHENQNEYSVSVKKSDSGGWGMTFHGTIDGYEDKQFDDTVMKDKWIIEPLKKGSKLTIKS